MNSDIQQDIWEKRNKQAEKVNEKAAHTSQKLKRMISNKQYVVTGDHGFVVHVWSDNKPDLVKLNEKMQLHGFKVIGTNRHPIWGVNYLIELVY